MIPTKIFSAFLFGAIFLSSTAATPSSNAVKCYKCPQAIYDKEHVQFDFVKEVPSQKHLEC